MFSLYILYSIYFILYYFIFHITLFHIIKVYSNYKTYNCSLLESLVNLNFGVLFVIVIKHLVETLKILQEFRKRR